MHWEHTSMRRTCTGSWRSVIGRTACSQAEKRLAQVRELAKVTGSRLTKAELARDLDRLNAETGRVKEAHATLREAAQAFQGARSGRGGGGD
jgi:hypothetical protein